MTRPVAFVWAIDPAWTQALRSLMAASRITARTLPWRSCATFSKVIGGRGVLCSRATLAP